MPDHLSHLGHYYHCFRSRRDAGCDHRYIPEEALHRYGTPRPAFLALVGLVTAAASTMAAFAGLGALFPASIIAGLAFGAPGPWSFRSHGSHMVQASTLGQTSPA